MKLVSPMSLLTALLGFVVVVIKALTFQPSDIFWIVFIGYISVRGLVMAFSQEAYDENVKQTQQGRVLYRDLFGKFAYVAADVPLFLLLCACLLAAVFPVTAYLRVIVAGLFLLALGYAIWFHWYVSRHKRLRIADGAWGAGVLSAEDEKAWKRSELWHDVVLGTLVLAGILYLIFSEL